MLSFYWIKTNRKQRCGQTAQRQLRSFPAENTLLAASHLSQLLSQIISVAIGWLSYVTPPTPIYSPMAIHKTRSARSATYDRSDTLSKGAILNCLWSWCDNWRQKFCYIFLYPNNGYFFIISLVKIIMDLNYGLDCHCWFELGLYLGCEINLDYGLRFGLIQINNLSYGFELRLSKYHCV